MYPGDMAPSSPRSEEVSAAGHGQVSTLPVYATFFFPEEVWKNILLHASGDVFYFLRQTCRTVLRVSESIIAKLLGVERSKLWRPEATMWLDGLKYVLTADQKIIVRQILLQTQLCDACLRFRQTGGYVLAKAALYTVKWCSGCEREHPAIFFSDAQRATQDDQRLCIGREGSVRTCEHQQLNWQLTKIADDQNKKQTAACQHFIHGDPHGYEQAFSNHNDKPTVTVTVARKTSIEHYREVTFCWKVLAFKHSPDEELTFSVLRQKLKLMSKQLKLEFCPHLSLDDDSVPSIRSTAAAWRPAFRLGTTPSCARPQAAQTNAVCASQPSTLFRGTFLPVIESEQLAPHAASCSVCRLQYAWTRSDDQVHLSIRQFQTIDANSPNDPRWVGLLDTDSIQLKDDLSAKHITWCDDGNCITSYRRRTHQHILEESHRLYEEELQRQREEAEALAAEEEGAGRNKRARTGP